jgi:hypothetical protein
MLCPSGSNSTIESLRTAIVIIVKPSFVRYPDHFFRFAASIRDAHQDFHF